MFCSKELLKNVAKELAPPTLGATYAHKDDTGVCLHLLGAMDAEVAEKHLSTSGSQRRVERDRHLRYCGTGVRHT